MNPTSKNKTDEPAESPEGLDAEPIDAVSLSPVSAAPTPPTSPAPGVTQRPVAVEPLDTPAPILNFDRIKHPIGKRGRRAAERAARRD